MGTLYGGLAGFDEQRQTDYTTLKSELDTLEAAIAATTTPLQAAIDAIDAANVSVTALVGEITGPEGLIAGLNCTFVYDLLVNFNETFCRGFV